MKGKFIIILSISVLVVGLSFMAAENASAAFDKFMMSGLVGIPAPFMSLHGVPGAMATWSVADSVVHLEKNGELLVKVKGLVTATGVPPNTLVFASLTCEGTIGTVATVLAGSSLSLAGDAKIKGPLVPFPPSSCVGPIILITTSSTLPGPSPAGPWIAATGF